MRMSGAILVLAAATAAAPRTIGVTDTATGTISERLNGCHFSPLNHQLAVVHSQMVFDESFEERLDDKPHTAPAGNPYSLGWSNLSAAPATGTSGFVLDPLLAFNGNVSYCLGGGCAGLLADAPPDTAAASRPSGTSEFPPGPAGLAGEVGLIQRGLYKAGYLLQQGKPYVGYVFARLARPSDPHATLEVRLENEVGAAGGGAAAVLASTGPLAVTNTSWTKFDFELTPSATTACGRDGTVFDAPIDCETSNSDLTGACVRCGGRLVVAVATPSHQRRTHAGAGGARPPGADAAAGVLVDQVFLSPGPWGTLATADGRQLLIKPEPVAWVQRMGTKLLRYGGTFSKGMSLAWANYRGPPWLRPPIDGHLTKLHRWSRGFGYFEVMELCEAINVTCVLSFPLGQTPAEMADFITYAYGNASTALGALRARDGRVAPYKPIWIQMGNEERMADLAGWPNRTGMAAAAQIAAMRARAAQVNPKMAPLLRFVLGSDAGSDAGGNVVADGTVIGNTTAIFRQIKAMAGTEACAELVFDWHITPGQIDNGSNRSSVNPDNLEKLDRLARDEGCGGANVAVLETNKCDSHFDRALANAVTASAAQRWSKIIVAHCESQCWNAAGHADGCGEGHIEVLQNQTWGTPAYYGAQMVYDSYAPLSLTVKDSARATDLPLATFAVGKRNSSSGGAELEALRVVNPNNVSIIASVVVSTALQMRVARAGGLVKVNTMTSPLSSNQTAYHDSRGGANGLTSPTFIIPKRHSVPSSALAGFVFPAQSITVFNFTGGAGYS